MSEITDPYVQELVKALKKAKDYLGEIKTYVEFLECKIETQNVEIHNLKLEIEKLNESNKS